jgi:hypothetical protein
VYAITFPRYSTFGLNKRLAAVHYQLYERAPGLEKLAPSHAVTMLAFRATIGLTCATICSITLRRYLGKPSV